MCGNVLAMKGIITATKGAQSKPIECHWKRLLCAPDLHQGIEIVIRKKGRPFPKQWVAIGHHSLLWE